MDGHEIKRRAIGQQRSPGEFGPVKISRRALLKNTLLALTGPLVSGTSVWGRNANPLYGPKIRLFYRPEMVLKSDVAQNYSKSPLKPKLFVQYLKQKRMLKYFATASSWPPFERGDFLMAHTPRYVNAFFNGTEPLASSNRLVWSQQFADSVRYTNASLYHALKAATVNPATVTFSPTSGFHHATPESGGGYCTFSGQVIASAKIYRDRGLSGAYIDLDGHFGNSLEDSREFLKELNQAVPPGCNVNPEGSHRAYLDDLRARLRWIRTLLLQKKLHYVVFAHGADSHQWDNLGGQCTTEEWLEAAALVYGMLNDVSRTLGKPVPLVLTLFGGYRKDDYDSVLSLHTADAVLCLSRLCGNPISYRPEVKRPT